MWSSFFSRLLEAVSPLDLWSCWRRISLIFSVIFILFLQYYNFLTSNKPKILVKNLNRLIPSCNWAINILFHFITCMRKRKFIQNNNFLFLIQVLNIIKFVTDLIEEGIHWLISQWLSRIFWPWSWWPFSRWKTL